MRRREVRVLPGALRNWRAERGVSQSELAKAAGVSEALIGLIETGRRQPSLDSARAIAGALEVPVEAFAELLVDPEEPVEGVA